MNDRLGRADLHIHTLASDGTSGLEEILEHAIHVAALDVIAITDHERADAAFAARQMAVSGGLPIEVVVGEEVTTLGGHLLALYIQETVRPLRSLRATIAAIHEQGGIAFAAHPFWRTQSQARGRGVHGVGWLAADLDLDAIEVENSTPGFYLFNQMAVRLNQDVGLAPLGNSDAHILDAIGRSYTSFPGQTASALRLAIEERRTQAHRLRYPALALVRYAAWGLEHRRQRRLASTRRSA
jgi:predicted metal-dependent phosphoesterase TrpH